jgi:cell division protein FtsW
VIKRLNIELKGDRALWIISITLAVLSFLPVYSASSNLTYVVGGSSPLFYLFKHILILFGGFVIMYVLHRLNYRYFAPLSLIALPFAAILLIYTFAQGTTIGGANASRWIMLPGGFSFQTSALASIVLMVYLARYLSKHQGEINTLKAMWFPILLPIAVICGLILPANFSTTAIVFVMCMILLFLGGVHWKPLVQILGMGIAGLVLFIVVVLAFPGISNRVDTWKARIENYANGDAESNYQVEKAKMAIADGYIIGKGPGKSMQKNFLPQSNSDFIYAIIVEEYGLFGGTLIILFYVWLFVRIIRIALNAPNTYGMLLAIAAGMGLILQAVINMGVAVHLFPVTGQTLPLISSGGTSVWMTCAALGIILSVSQAKNTDEADENNPEEPFETPLEDAQAIA